MYLSGRIECMDEKNFAVLQEGVQLFKQYRSFICTAYPRMIAPHVSINDTQTWQAVALADEAGSHLLVAVWRNASDSDTFTVELGTAGQTVTVEQRFPTTIRDTSWTYDQATGRLTVRLSKKETARLLEIVVE